MKRSTATWALLGTFFVSTACSGGSDVQAGGPETAENDPAAEPAVEVQDTDERLIERSKTRLDVMCSGDWIEVYDFIHPQTKEWMSIYQFLEGKDNHEYAEPTKPQIVAREGDTAYLSVTALWTPKHPMLANVDNVPVDWDPTERIEWIETWQFAGGDWHMQWPQQYPGDFFEEHPELLKKNEPAGGDDEVALADPR